MPVKNGDYICTRHEKIKKVLLENKLDTHDIDIAHYMGIRMEQGLLQKNREIKKRDRRIAKLEKILEEIYEKMDNQ